MIRTGCLVYFSFADYCVTVCSLRSLDRINDLDERSAGCAGKREYNEEDQEPVPDVITQ